MDDKKSGYLFLIIGYAAAVLAARPAGFKNANEEVCSVCDTVVPRKLGGFSNNSWKDDTDAHAAFLREAAPLADA
jgi:hypothetical protein